MKYPSGIGGRWIPSSGGLLVPLFKSVLSLRRDKLRPAFAERPSHEPIDNRAAVAFVVSAKVALFNINKPGRLCPWQARRCISDPALPREGGIRIAASRVAGTGTRDFFPSFASLANILATRLRVCPRSGRLHLRAIQACSTNGTYAQFCPLWKFAFVQI